MQNIILAQSIGIAPAKKLSFTPFSKIVAYLNITDDIAAGNSHFKAGVLRARDVLMTVRNERTKGRCLTNVDELFNGTPHKEAQAAGYSFLKLLGAENHNLCIATTHFPRVPELERETENFTNYKVSVGYDRSSGKIAYPYKLERGIADQVITFQILQEEGFDDEFLQEAQRVLNEDTQ